jgi:hypothetical protein
MPEPDIFDLDEAFSSLERDVATISSPRSAGQAVATARRRRRSTFGAVAAVAVLAVGAVAIGQGLGGRSSSIAPSEQPLPPPTPLSAEAFSTATAGWVDGWGKPTSTQGDSLGSITCLSHGVDTNPLNRATRQGGAVYGAGSTEAAYVLGLDFSADRIDAARAAIAAAAANCTPAISSTTTYQDGSEVTFYQLPATSGTGHLELWTADFGDRLGLAIVGGTANEPPADVVGHVDDLLIGALQVDKTFTTNPAGGVTGGSSSASSADFGTVAESAFASALGAWPNGWQERGTKSTAEPLPCAGDWTTGSSSGMGASLGGNGEQDFYNFDSAESAAASVTALSGNLESCASSPATVTGVGGTAPAAVVVGSGTDPRVTWIVQRGATVGYVTIPGDTRPPVLVSEAVAGLVGDVLDHVGQGPPPVESSTPVKQQGGTSSSASSAAAPKG